MTGVLFLFPGQGSQSRGMTRFLEAYEPAAGVLADAAAALPFDLFELCENGPAELLTRTDIAQPAIFATSLATWAALSALVGWTAPGPGISGPGISGSGKSPTSIFLGHSLGDYSALAASGHLPPADALRVVAARGRAMRAAGAEGEGGMSAVLGVEDALVEEVCRAYEDVWPANYNSPGQLVVSGRLAALGRFEREVVEAGARKAVRLPVSGAFHSPLMEPAAGAIQQALAGVAVCGASGGRFFSTTETAFLAPSQVAEAMVRQVTSAVRFTQSVLAVRSQVGLAVEVGPGKVLSGLVKRIAPELPVLSTDSEKGLLQAAEALKSWGGPGGER